MKLKEFNRILDDSAKFNITNRVDEFNLDGFVEVQNHRRKPVYQRLVLSAMAILFVCMIAVFGVVSNKPVATLSIDINPSIEIDLNTFNNVVDIRGINEDGIEFIENLEYKGRAIDTVINEIYTSSIEEGYFTEDEAYMLIGVYGNDSISESEIDDILNEISDITILILSMSAYVDDTLNDDQENSLSGYEDNCYTTTIASPEYQTTTVGASEGMDDGVDNTPTNEYNEDITSAVDVNLTIDDISEITDLYNISETLAYLIIDILNFDLGYTLDGLANMEIKDLIIIYNNQ